MPQSPARRQDDARLLVRDVLEIAPLADHHQPAQPALVAVPLTAHRIQLWDLPLRIFHWSLLAAVATAIVTGRLGGEWMGVHGKAGLSIVGLLAFRVTWGFLGSTHARFVNFLPTPGRLVAYLRGRWQGVGHNPLGALSVLALIGLLGAQAGTGLFGNDEIAFTGPLAAFVEETTSLKLTSWHHQLAPLLYGLLGLHIAAIAFYALIKRQKLIKPMVTGWKTVPPAVKPPRRARPIALLASLAVATGAVVAASGLWAHSPTAAAPDSVSTQGNTRAPAAGTTSAAPAF